jgi:hypothetical protein
VQQRKKIWAVIYHKIYNFLRAGTFHLRSRCGTVPWEVFLLWRHWIIVLSIFLIDQQRLHLYNDTALKKRPQRRKCFSDQWISSHRVGTVRNGTLSGVWFQSIPVRVVDEPQLRPCSFLYEYILIVFFSVAPHWKPKWQLLAEKVTFLLKSHFFSENTIS